MGMFDYVNYETVCPVCHAKVADFQTKDSECLLETLEPVQVNNFYASCRKCGCWIEFNRLPNPVEKFVRTVQGKNWTDLPEHRKEIKIKK